MKIEKVSDNQIRCTLTKEDLADRQLKLSELAYGTEKAKSLFRDMMQQASYEFGFEAEDIPLMIEAIPLSPDCIILIITKVEDPDELDTRFSKFAPTSDTAIGELENLANSFAEGADDILDLFKKIHQEAGKDSDTEDYEELPQSLKDTDSDSKTSPEVEVPTMDITRSFKIDSLDCAIRIAHVLKGFYQGNNTLYKNTDTNRYMLFLRKSEHTPEDFNKVCNILAEYAVAEKYSTASEAFYQEHYKVILPDTALQNLAEV